MPLESATFLTQLVPTNPAHTDGLSQADSHLRLLKTVLQDTFPNLGTTVTCAPTDLNVLTGMVNSGTVALPGTVVQIAAPSGTGTVGGEVVLEGPGTIAAMTLTNTNGTLVAAGGTLLASTALSSPSIQKSGSELLPTGVICMWSGASTAIPAGWHLCDGTSGTPNLEGMFVVGAGGSYTVGQAGGVVTQTGTTDSQGAHSHTGATSSAGSHSHTGVTAPYALAISDIPTHTHGLSDPAHAHGPLAGGVGFIQEGGSSIYTPGSGGSAGATTNGAYTGITIQNTGGGGAHSHGIYTESGHTHVISTDGGHTHGVLSFDNRPPFYALCFIMKL